MEKRLFEMPEEQTPKESRATLPEEARVIRAVRNQVEFVSRNLDESIPADHSVRAIWAFLERLDLSAFYASIKSVLSHAGHPATDPQVLLGLWLFATADGVGSARRLARLCEEHDAYRWLRGGVPINYHTLADFRVGHQEALDELMTQVLAAMMSKGLVTLRHVAQDGMKVRASAGSSSFRREERLEQFLVEAKEQVARLAKEREAPEPGVSRRQEAARERAARERQTRIEEALKQLPALKALKEKQRKRLSKKDREKIKEPRVSTTDGEVRVMKMGDGGFRPAYNLEIATDVDSQVIVGVAATNQGSDAGQAAPMVEQVEKRTGVRPEAYLMDGDFAKLGDITTIERQGIEVYAPEKKSKDKRIDETLGKPKEGDTPEVVKWRERMKTEEGKTIYKERAATAECVNAQGRAHGLVRLMVRGTGKVQSVLILAAIAHNLLRWEALAKAANLG